MSYFKDKKFNKNRKDFKGKVKTTPDSDLDEKKRKDSGMPDKKNSEVDLTFQKKAFKDMSFDSYSIKVNPQGEVSEEADPYAVVNRTNVVVDASYAGNDNTAGSVVPQLANGTTSTFKDVTDIVETEVVINYGYCAYNNETEESTDSLADSKVNKYMTQPYNDVLESVVAEAFTDLAFFKWQVRTAPLGSEETTTPPSGDGLLDLILSYQATVQQVLLVPQAYRTIRSLEQHLKDMCYMAGSSKLNDMYGRLKKSSFINAIKGVSEAMMYHYTDTDWWRQVNMLISVPCRKSNSMIDPLICLRPVYRINGNLYVNDGNGNELFSTASTMSLLVNKCATICERLSPYVLIRMARNKDLTSGEILSWFNGIADLCDEVVTLLDQFSADFKEMLVAFKRMAKVGITGWQYGQFISVDSIDNKYQPKFNKLVYDIVRSMATGSAEIKYNLQLNQWQTSSLWDLFLGIPSYDYKSGGSILTFSSHDINKPVGTPATISYPALFSKHIAGGYFMRCLTRSDYEYTILSDDFKLGTTTEFRRLMPLSSYQDLKFRCPVIMMTGHNYSTDDETIVNYYNAADNSTAQNVMSWALFALAKIFGYVRQIKSRSGNPGAYVYTYNDNIETDALCFIDVVIDDQSNAIQTFCRKHSPFRTVKASSVDKIGFANSKQ